MSIKIKRAILSVSDKTGLIEFARELAAANVELLASGGTAEQLRDAGLNVIEVSDYTGAPEILDGRVKTLHPKVHGGILARRDLPNHVDDLARRDIGTIDLVVVNLYPFEQTVADAGVSLADAVEQIDIGGPTLLRAAAKNFAHVVAVCDPEDYGAVGAAVREESVTEELATHLARKVFARIAAYDAAISNFLEMRAADNFPAVWTAQWRKVQDLRYGENPHQSAALYSPPGSKLGFENSLQGKPLSYNNILDLSAAIETARTLQNFKKFAAVVVKHGNPCGVGVCGKSLSKAFERAKAGDPVSAFGGIVAVTTEIDATSAELIAETFFEVVCAPSFSKEALEIFASKKNLRLIPYDLNAQSSLQLRSVGEAFLVQDVDRLHVARKDWECRTKRAPSESELDALELSWLVGAHVHSNAIVICDSRRLLGVGAGQMSRLDSVKLADLKQKAFAPEAELRVASSDAFFPFRDGLDALAAAGVTAVVQPGGSVRDDEVVAAANEHNIAMLFTGERHFKH